MDESIRFPQSLRRGQRSELWEQQLITESSDVPRHGSAAPPHSTIWPTSWELPPLPPPPPSLQTFTSCRFCYEQMQFPVCRLGVSPQATGPCLRAAVSSPRRLDLPAVWRFGAPPATGSGQLKLNCGRWLFQLQHAGLAMQHVRSLIFGLRCRCSSEPNIETSGH